MDSVADRLRAAVGNVGAALDTVGEGFEKASAAEVPINTGYGRASLKWVRTSETQGYLEVVWYLPYQATARPVLSAAPRNVRARLRYMAAVGHPVTHPNDWITRAWESEAVQEAIAQFPQLLFSRG